MLQYFSNKFSYSFVIAVLKPTNRATFCPTDLSLKIYKTPTNLQKQCIYW